MRRGVLDVGERRAVRMKAITLHQPWATLVAYGLKSVETRSWPTMYRGPLAIHAGRGTEGKPVMGLPEYRQPLSLLGYRQFEDLPRGVIVAVARLRTVQWTGHRERKWVDELSEMERTFGNYDADRYGWVLENVERLLTPLAAIGRQRLWDVHVPAGIPRVPAKER